MKPATVARRDAILCAVRDGALVTTSEVCRAICERCAHFFPDGRPNENHHYAQVYADLRALARADLVEWIPAGSTGYGKATFMLSMKARERFVTVDLEAVWVASDPSGGTLP